MSKPKTRDRRNASASNSSSESSLDEVSTLSQNSTDISSGFSEKNRGKKETSENKKYEHNDNNNLRDDNLSIKKSQKIITSKKINNNKQKDIKNISNKSEINKEDQIIRYKSKEPNSTNMFLNKMDEYDEWFKTKMKKKCNELADIINIVNASKGQRLETALTKLEQMRNEIRLSGLNHHHDLSEYIRKNRNLSCGNNIKRSKSSSSLNSNSHFSVKSKNEKFADRVSTSPNYPSLSPQLLEKRRYSQQSNNCNNENYQFTLKKYLKEIKNSESLSRYNREEVNPVVYKYILEKDKEAAEIREVEKKAQKEKSRKEKKDRLKNEELQKERREKALLWIQEKHLLEKMEAKQELQMKKLEEIEKLKKQNAIREYKAQFRTYSGKINSNSNLLNDNKINQSNCSLKSREKLEEPPVSENYQKFEYNKIKLVHYEANKKLNQMVKDSAEKWTEKNKPNEDRNSIKPGNTTIEPDKNVDCGLDENLNEQKDNYKLDEDSNISKYYECNGTEIQEKLNIKSSNEKNKLQTNINLNNYYLDSSTENNQHAASCNADKDEADAFQNTSIKNKHENHRNNEHVNDNKDISDGNNYGYNKPSTQSRDLELVNTQKTNINNNLNDSIHINDLEEIISNRKPLISSYEPKRVIIHGDEDNKNIKRVSNTNERKAKKLEESTYYMEEINILDKEKINENKSIDMNEDNNLMQSARPKTSRFR